jgi:branched-chain amino acid aminotransferase
VTSDPTRWGVTSLRLQQPKNVYFGGEVRPWDEAVLHVSTEAVTRGLNVFEGLKGYWQSSGEFAWRSLERHYTRMTRSARLLHIPVDFSYDDFVEACFALTEAELREENDLYIRATLFVTAGHYGEGTEADLVLTAYQQDTQRPAAVDVGTSTWHRAPDLALPARLKTSSNYVVARLARIEGASRGYTDMILLNQAGRVAEGIASCIAMVRDGVLISPPPSEGALESITLDIVAALARDAGIEVAIRPVERSELYIADELALVGTLAEVTPIRSVDEVALPDEAPVLGLLGRRYHDAVTGAAPTSYVALSRVPSRAR